MKLTDEQIKQLVETLQNLPPDLAFKVLKTQINSEK